ncbi:hypothetical protein RD792_017163 [Penstemon davidsonii]|uniref:CCHC-type domain-containing protein n=1 Tax=Penstemon davidsonii TaxID=160366 RepID=A0ABR0CMW6_9LAMI|nr:hypothetical protein RD792_017163 [Penstemon davidsonii]
MMARLRVHIFLSGLDPEFDKVRGEILRKDPKLDLESTYAHIRREAQQRQIMGGSRPVPESSAMVAHRNSQGPNGNYVKGRNNSPSGKTNNFVCSHCGETGHSKQKCYEIIGYSDWWDFSKKPRKNITGRAAVAIQGDARSTQEEKSHPTANVAQPGSFGKANVFSVTSGNSTWIIDTGASDHMVKNSNILQTIHSSSQSIISTANGTTSPIIGEGSVVLSNTLKLDTVLVVPSLECNLLSVSQLTSSLNCTVELNKKGTGVEFLELEAMEIFLSTENAFAQPSIDTSDLPENHDKEQEDNEDASKEPVLTPSTEEPSHNVQRNIAPQIDCLGCSCINPQTKILGHLSIGGFVSHCGWSSTTESMYFGVQVIGMPMKSEQPLNARLKVEVGVGVEVVREKRDNIWVKI